LEEVYDIWKMTSIKRQKNGRANEKLWGGGWLSCFGRSVKYGGTVYTFREEEIAELHELPKKIAPEVMDICL